MQKPQLPPPGEIQKPGLTTFVGAVSDGYYGAVGFDFISPHDLIRARKSWFFFDDVYVCLGAGIESQSYSFPLATTLDQTLLKGDVLLDRGSGAETLEEGEHELEGVKWVYHRGCGYIFPEPTSIQLSNQEESGSWRRITHQSYVSREQVEMDVFKLWIDHGVRPQGRRGGLVNTPMLARDVKYEYMVVPSTEPGQMDIDRGIKVLFNERLLQAVKSEKTGLVQAIFYQAGELVISENLKISIDSPAALILKTDSGVISEISAADPSRTLSKLHLSITDRAGEQERTIELPTGDFAGQSVVLVL
jgi:chondroitin AC lyase